ncbi:N-acetylmuramoyl-L-alanine amidase family protein [Huintestinicola sp.]|uniref:N-acetylmuramoyl-L-alanine amidase family protein n=1 Tax=Huintestinicola sp. TaxID=2981661 RepID=UPI003D7EF64E
MKFNAIKKTAVICMAAAAVLSASANCFAAEWKETSKGMTYIDDSGKTVTGMQEIDGETYYFNSKGIMKKGWLTTKSGKKYYFNSDGTMRTGWLKLKSGKYYFSMKGVMSVGSVKIDKNYYYFDEDGVMVTGWQDVDGTDYYYCSDGKRAVNKTVTIDGKKVKFDRNGKVKTGSSSSGGSKVEKEEETEKIVPDEIIVTNTKFTISKGAKFKLAYSFKPIKTNCTDVSFKSSNSNVISVNSRGEIEALKSGKANITIKSEANSSAYVVLEITVE